MRPEAALIEVRDVHFAYPAGDASGIAPPPALDGVSLDLRAGELVGLIGQNGSGKTTLARHLNGLLKPLRGSVRVKGVDTRGSEPGRLAATVGYVFQNPDHALFLPSVREEVEYGLRLLDFDDEEIRERADMAMRRFGLAGMEARHPASLGRGMRRLVVLAAADALEPDVLVLDEPTGGLDRRLTGELMARLADIAGQDRTVLLISHDMQLVADHCERVVALHQGRIVADAAPRELFARGDLLDRIGIAAPQVGRLAGLIEHPGFDRGLVATDDFVAAFVAQARSRAGGDQS